MGIGFYYYGIFYTSATFAANFLNTIPIVTFLLAAVLRMEKVGLRTVAGKVKVSGTIICVGGATMITLYKGSSFKLFPAPLWHQHQPVGANAERPNWTTGSLMLAASSLSDALWFIAQVKLLKVYAAKYSATALTCWAGTLQSVVIGFAMRRDPSAWKLGLDLRLITIIYSGILTSGATFCLITWCISKRGPIYVTMFSPLVLVLVSISESLFLGERLYVGRGGLFAFLWGKSKESSLQATSHEADNRHSCGGGDSLSNSVSSTSETA
ncbi:WAT1-related protein [Nymphaea thermarum]|nr:WAT1-related protein [Nymphaea thermarum]